MKKDKWLFIILSLFLILFYTGCGKKEEDITVLVDASDSSVSYKLVPTEITDVILTQRLDAVSVQSKDQEVSFNFTGKYVDKVYVRKGDIVKKGDILCELSYDSLEESIEDLEYNVKKNEMELEYSVRDEELEIQDAWVNAMYNSPGGYNEESVKDYVKGIQESYERKRVLINDSLEFDREELERKKDELKNSRLYATMDGTVYKIDDKLEGSTTKAGEVIMTIIDGTECFFVVKDTEFKDLINPEDLLEMKVSYTKASGDYLVKPYEMDKWDEKMKFSVYSKPDGANVEVGTTGTISILLDKHEHVLALPKNVVHEVEGKYFVYTLSEENVREIRYIEVGLVGDEYVEIISGLSEGEKVVKR